MPNERESEIHVMLSMAQAMDSIDKVTVQFIETLQKNPNKTLFWAQMVFLYSVIGSVAALCARKLRKQAIRKRTEWEKRHNGKL